MNGGFLNRKTFGWGMNALKTNAKKLLAVLVCATVVLAFIAMPIAASAANKLQAGAGLRTVFDTDVLNTGDKTSNVNLNKMRRSEEASGLILGSEGLGGAESGTGESETGGTAAPTGEETVGSIGGAPPTEEVPAELPPAEGEENKSTQNPEEMPEDELSGEAVTGLEGASEEVPENVEAAESVENSESSEQTEEYEDELQPAAFGAGITPLLLGLTVDLRTLLSGGSLVTGIHVTQTDGTPFADTPPQITVGDEFLLWVDVHIPTLTLNILNEYYFEFSLPSNLVVTPPGTLALTSGGVNYGTIAVNTSTGKVRITLDSTLSLAIARTATFSLTVKLDSTKVLSAGGITISLPSETGVAPVSINALLPTGGGDPALPPVNINDLLNGGTILTDISITQADGTPFPTDPPQIEIGDLFRLCVDFAIPDNIVAQITEGSYYEFSLPDNMRFGFINDFDLLDANGIKRGTVSVDSATGLVRMTFLDLTGLGSDIGGKFCILGKLDENVVTNPGGGTISIPGEETIPPVEIEIKPTVNSAIEKEGYFDNPYNPSEIIWNVDINKALDSLTGVTVVENLPAGTQLTGVRIYPVEVDLFGNVVSVGTTPLSPSEYTVDPVTGNVTFLNGIDTAYRIEYHTQITDKPAAGGQQSYTNEATLQATDLIDITTSSSVEAQFGKALEKVSSVYDPVNQIFRWTIYYNFNESHITENNAYIIDTYDTSVMELILASVTLNWVDFDENGTPSNGGVLQEGVDYEIITSTDGFRINFLHDIDRAVEIGYSTHVNGVVDDNITITNGVEDGGGNSGGSGGTVIGQGLHKTVANVDHSTNTITWEITVNRNNNNMHNWVLTDGFTPGPPVQVFWPSSGNISITDDYIGDYVLQEGTDYTVSYTSNGTATTGFVISFINSYAETNHNFTIRYTTVYDLDHLEDGGLLANNVNAVWTDDDDIEHSNDSSASYRPTPEEISNGAKSGSYNYVTKEITWTVRIDYSAAEMKNAYLLDPILEGQAFVAGSLHVYKYTVQPNGTPVRGGELTPAEYALLDIDYPSAANGNTLRIDFPDGSEKYWVEFKTTVEGTIINNTYENTAHFHNDNYHDAELDASVSVNHGGELISKSGEQESDGVWWTILVNASQSTMQDVVVTDIPSPNQHVDLASVVIYGTTVNAEAGALQTDTSVVLEEGTDYTVDFYENTNSDWVLEIRFINEISKAYVIRYKTLVFIGEGEPPVVTNNVTIKGNNIEEVEGEDGGTVIVDVGQGGGIITGHRGLFVIHKTDGLTGEALSGAMFQLYTKEGVPIDGTITTGATGAIVFENLLYGTYVLKELEAPEGYSIPQSLQDGVEIVVDENSSNINDFTDFENYPSEAVLIKQDIDGNVLVGAQFSLYHWQNGGWVQIRENESFVSGDDGRLEIYGLPKGQYRLLETSAPEGYEINTTPIAFTIEEENGALVNADIGVFINKAEVTPNPPPKPPKQPTPPAVTVTTSVSGEEVITTKYISPKTGDNAMTELLWTAVGFLSTVALTFGTLKIVQYNKQR